MRAAVYTDQGWPKVRVSEKKNIKISYTDFFLFDNLDKLR